MRIKKLALLAFAVVVVGCCPDKSAVQKPQIATFLWAFDTSEGIALTYAVEKPAMQDDSSVKITVSLAGAINQHWEIRETAAYFWDEGKRRRCIREGPFPWRRWTAVCEGQAFTWYTWTMHGLTRPQYDFTVLLHKKKDGMPFSEVTKALSRIGPITFRSDELPPLGPRTADRPAGG